MHRNTVVSLAGLFWLSSFAHGQSNRAADPIRMLVAKLDLQQYKDTIKALTKFGDRVQGTKRNRDAIDWIEAQLKSYGCANTERITYEYQPPAPPAQPLDSAAIA